MGALYFYKYQNIDGADKRLPKDRNLVAFFNLSDTRYFIYALCTNRKLQGPELCEVTLDTYDAAKQFFVESESCSVDDLTEIFTETEEEIAATIRYSILKATFDNMSFGELLGID